MHHPLPAALLTATLALTGCFSYQPGRVDPQPVDPIPPDAWPARNLEAVRPFHDRTPDRIFRYALADGARVEDLPPEFAPFVDQQPDYTIHHNHLGPRGLLRCYTDHFPGDEFTTAMDELIFGFQPNAAFLTSRTVADPEFQNRRAELDANSSAIDLALADRAPGLSAARVPERIALHSGMRLRLPLEIPENPRGTLVHFTAMFGNDPERETLDALRERGWVVASISTDAFLDAPTPPADAERIAELDAQSDQLLKELGPVTQARYETTDPAEKARLENREEQLWEEILELRLERAELARSSFQLCDESDVEPVAAAIARAADDLLAEHAYAAEAALAFVHDRFPALAEKPVVVIGFSAGSFAAPAAAAWLGDSIDAVVLIGGGANIVAAAVDSDFSDGGIRVRCGDDEPGRDLIDAVADAYLHHARLDPYHAAPHLRRLPVLLITARHDAWVPAETGQLLAQRLGQPTRLIHRGGHRSLFYFLPSQSDRIADWLDEALN